MNHRARFAKPTELYDVLDLFGRNIVSTEGEEWRAHRKITAPSFTEVRPFQATPAFAHDFSE